MERRYLGNSHRTMSAFLFHQMPFIPTTLSLAGRINKASRIPPRWLNFLPRPARRVARFLAKTSYRWEKIVR
jgi:hypothetical protein